MNLKNLAGLGIAAIAAVGFAVISMNAVAKTNHNSSCPKNVKCYGVNKNGDGYVLVSKSACEQIGGSTTNPNNNHNNNDNNNNNNNNGDNNSTNPSTPAPSMTSPDAGSSTTAPETTTTPETTPSGGVTTSNPNQ